jgi:hypothetical protein
MKAIFYLVVPVVCVQKVEGLRTYRGVDNLVDPWQNKVLLWAGEVEVGVVNAHSLGVVLLLHEDWICQTLWVLYCTDETDSE